MTVQEFRTPPSLERLFRVMAVVGGICLLAGAILAPQRTWANLLLASYYLLALGLSGTVFVAIQYVTGSSWSVAFRRVPEALSHLLPYVAPLFLLVLIISPFLYPWFHDQHTEAEPTFWFKHIWLTPAFFVVRSIIYLSLWIMFSYFIVRSSRRQDADGNPSHTYKNIRLSAGFLVVFAITFWLASFDWIMSLEPHWYSTIFGLYHFAGLFLGGLAMITILAIWLERRGPLRGILTPEHLHDLGKLLFAFSTFWMYIWFCQYMLIWYANIPEETSYFVDRVRGFWGPVFLLNFLLNWAVPFVVLLSLPAKRNPSILLEVCWTILVGRWVDLYLMIFPPLVGDHPVFGVWEVGFMLGTGGVFFLVLFRAFRSAPLVPVNDPFLAESLHYHN
ncbi:MAG: hypothetical protein A3H27_02500 [Acidobacteria bacterium RIFCSPLOWO2_02_FULL_59_13]|nr:MAG: hypothetical protein A3H27_02500 [Acidobacteria bacterium RIFCSPLOWO2_02_FULL_59_13]